VGTRALDDSGNLNGNRIQTKTELQLSGLTAVEILTCCLVIARVTKSTYRATSKRKQKTLGKNQKQTSRKSFKG